MKIPNLEELNTAYNEAMFGPVSPDFMLVDASYFFPYNPWTFSFWDEEDNTGIKLGPLSICGYSNKFYGFGFEIHWMNKPLLQIGDLFT